VSWVQIFMGEGLLRDSIPEAWALPAVTQVHRFARTHAHSLAQMHALQAQMERGYTEETTARRQAQMERGNTEETTARRQAQMERGYTEEMTTARRQAQMERIHRGDDDGDGRRRWRGYTEEMTTARRQAQIERIH
jgi:predicted DNA-binding WGR domain protein